MDWALDDTRPMLLLPDADSKEALLLLLLVVLLLLLVLLVLLVLWLLLLAMLGAWWPYDWFDEDTGLICLRRRALRLLNQTYVSASMVFVLIQSQYR